MISTIKINGDQITEANQVYKFKRIDNLTTSESTITLRLNHPVFTWWVRLLLTDVIDDIIKILLIKVKCKMLKSTVISGKLMPSMVHDMFHKKKYIV